MTWTYSGDPKKSELDKYRFLIGDVIQKDPILQDEEIQYILDSATDENHKLFELYERLANTFSRIIKRSLGPQSEDNSGRLKYFQDKANFYRALCATSSGLSLPKSVGPTFVKGMHDNV